MQCKKAFAAMVMKIFANMLDSEQSTFEESFGTVALDRFTCSYFSDVVPMYQCTSRLSLMNAWE
jgi:hypothetical protein